MAAREGSPAVSLAELDKATAASWDAIVAANSHTLAADFLFRYGNEPSRLERTDEGRLIPRPLTIDRMRHRLNEIGRWQRDGKNGPYTLAAAPLDLVRNVLATPDPPLPVLTRIVEVPVLGSDGSVHDTPGYGPTHRVFYEPAPGLVVPPLARRGPSAADVSRARDLLAVDLLGDFPFVGEAERAHALCLILQPFVRDLISGPTPLFLVEAPTPGTGKGLLAHVACWAMTGAPLPPMTEARDEDEWRKRITAVLRKSPTAVLIDNLGAPLDSAALSAALTSEWWEDRDLGHSRVITLPNRAIWIATGNNPALSGEIARRTVRIRLDAKVEHPEDRAEFRHKNLQRWADEHRGELVWAALTLARAWVVAGRPTGNGSLGSFEAWSEVLGGILNVAAVPGFLANKDDLRARAGSEREDMHAFLSDWRGVHGIGTQMRTRDLGPVLLAHLGIGGETTADIHRAGKMLHRYADRPFGDLVLRRGASRGGTATWLVEDLGAVQVGSVG